MKTKPTTTKKKTGAPTCHFCKRTGSGITFAIFTPRFKPFGTACTECEATLPEGTTLDAKPAEPITDHRTSEELNTRQRMSHWAFHNPA